MTEYEDRLAEAVRTGQAVLVVGTGASKAISGGDKRADWIGLIRDGITSAPGSENWKAAQEIALETSMVESDVSSLLGVASQVAAKLRGASEQAYADWLRDTVGALRPVNKRLALALGSLNLPIITTNYDTLIEQALTRPTVTWKQPEEMRQAFKMETHAVGHLHGVYDDPDSVIFSDQDYTRLILHERAQFIQDTYYATKSFIYVGFGSGIEDPNFSRLLEEHQRMFPNSRGDHFRLCREQEQEQLNLAHLGHDIRVVSYGRAHEDLAGFLEELASESAIHQIVGARDRLSYAREAILDQIRSETVVGAGLDGIDECELHHITVPPVLLPVPHEQFASMQELSEDLRPKRLNLDSIYDGNRIVVLAGEELAGVSTALRWLVAKAALEGSGAAPVFVDARNCRGTRAPLENQIRRECLNNRVIDTLGAELPKYVLAIDNLVPQDTSTYYQTLREISDCSARQVYIGVRVGDEQRLAQDLGQDISVEFAYLGKLGKPEIVALAQIVEPKRPGPIAEGVLDALKREHLPRNPFTISLLISLFAQLGEQSKHSSETAVLDDYVSLLLGRNGPFLDARYSLDPQNRETVLSELAKQFVRARKGALSREDTVRSMADYFRSVGWKEDAYDVLESFRTMRVLRVKNGTVQFQQSSYLHLFAAKAAIKDAKFLEELLADPVFFAPIVRHYAALVRSSERVIQCVDRLLVSWPENAPEGKIFGRVEKKAAPPELGRLFDGALPEEQADETEEQDFGRDESEEHLHEYDITDDADMVPFPLEDQSKLSPSMRMLREVDLASRVLRDSDQVSNLPLKVSVFKSVLIRWGITLDSLEQEEFFAEPARAIVDAIAEDGDLQPEKAENMAATIELFIPTFIIFAAINSCLSSRKLLLSFDEVLTDDEFQHGDFGLPMAAMFSFDLQERGWAKFLPQLVELHGDRWIVSEFIGMLATLAFRHQELSLEDEEAVRSFLMRRAEERFVFQSDADKSRRLGNYRQQITRERALNRRGRSPLGTPVIDRIIDK